MLTWITMTEIVMVSDDNYDADVDDNRCGWLPMWMTRWNYNEGWSDWLKLLGAPAVAMSPSYVHPWSTFYTTFLFNHDQHSTQHFYSTMINVLCYNFLNPRTTFYATLFSNHDQRSTLHLSQSKNNALQNTFLQSWSTFYATLFSNHDQPNSNSTHLWSIYPFYWGVCTVKGLSPI